MSSLHKSHQHWTVCIALYKEQLQNNKRLDKRHKRREEAVTVTGRRKLSKKRINHQKQPAQVAVSKKANWRQTIQAT